MRVAIVDDEDAVHMVRDESGADLRLEAYNHWLGVPLLFEQLLATAEEVSGNPLPKTSPFDILS